MFVKVCLQSQGRDFLRFVESARTKEPARDRNAAFPIAALLCFHNVGVLGEEGAEVFWFFSQTAEAFKLATVKRGH